MPNMQSIISVSPSGSSPKEKHGTPKSAARLKYISGSGNSGTLSASTICASAPKDFKSAAITNPSPAFLPFPHTTETVLPLISSPKSLMIFEAHASPALFISSASVKYFSKDKASAFLISFAVSILITFTPKRLPRQLHNHRHG